MEVDTLLMEKAPLGFPCSQNLINEETVLSLCMSNATQDYSSPRKRSLSPYKMSALSPRTIDANSHHDQGLLLSSYVTSRCTGSPRIVTPTTPHMQHPDHVDSTTPNHPANLAHSPRPASCPEHESMETEIESTGVHLMPDLIEEPRPGSEEPWRQGPPIMRHKRKRNLEDIVRRMKEDTGSEEGSLNGDLKVEETASHYASMRREIFEHEHRGPHGERDDMQDVKENLPMKINDEDAKINEIIKMENMINNHNLMVSKHGEQSPFLMNSGFLTPPRVNGWFGAPFGNGPIPPSPLLPPPHDQTNMPSPFFPMMPHKLTTPESEKDYLKCQFCERTFRRQKNLENHIENAHREGHIQVKRPEGQNSLYFKCTHCPYTTKHQSNLYVHIRIHTGERPYICGACGVQYSQSHSLKSHIINKHDGIMSYYIKEKRNRSPRGLSYVTSPADRHGFKHNGSPMIPSLPPNDLIHRGGQNIPIPFHGDFPLTLEHQQNLAVAMLNGQMPMQQQQQQQRHHHHLVEALIANQLKQKMWAEQRRSAEAALSEATYHDEDEAIDLSKKVYKDEPRFEDSTPSPQSEDSLHEQGLNAGRNGQAFMADVNDHEDRYIKEDERSVTIGDHYLGDDARFDDRRDVCTKTDPCVEDYTKKVYENDERFLKESSAQNGDMFVTNERVENVEEIDRALDINQFVSDDKHDCSHIWKLRTLRKNVMRMLSILVPNLNFEEKGITSESDSVDDLLQDVIESNIGESAFEENEQK